MPIAGRVQRIGHKIMSQETEEILVSRKPTDAEPGRRSYCNPVRYHKPPMSSDDKADVCLRLRKGKRDQGTMKRLVLYLKTSALLNFMNSESP